MQFATASQPYYPPHHTWSINRQASGRVYPVQLQALSMSAPSPSTHCHFLPRRQWQPGGGDRLSQLAIKCPSTTQANGLQDRRWCTAEQCSHCVVHARHHLFNRPWPALAPWTGPLVDKTPGQQRPLYRRKRLSRKRLSEFNRLLGGEQPVCYMLGQML